MKRFIDLGSQIGGNDEWPREFTWWDTVVDRFETHSGNQTWENWSDFERDFNGDDLERYRHLCPDWVFGVLSGEITDS